MTGPGRHARIGLAAALLWAAVSAAEAGAAADRATLTLSAGAPAFAGRGVEVTVEQHGFLAGQRITLLYFVDGDLVDRFTTDGGPTRHRLRHPRLVAGRHEIRVKSGSEDAVLSVRVWPVWIVFVGFAAAVGTTALALFRSRRRRRAG